MKAASNGKADLSVITRYIAKLDKEEASTPMTNGKHRRAMVEPGTDRIAKLEDEHAAERRAKVSPVMRKIKGVGVGMKLNVRPLNMKRIKFRLVGDAPYVQGRFGPKAFAKMVADFAKERREGEKRSRAKPARDYDDEFEESMHKAANGGWRGLPAPGLRNALIDACRTCDLKMTVVKQAVFVEADGFDEFSGQPLVKIKKGKPIKHISPGTNGDGSIAVRVRALWEQGWNADVVIKYDGDQLNADDIYHLLQRAGQQVGVGSGRPASTNSAGCGWGTFVVESAA